ncbi:hypothetical protein Golomagni_06748, partial [Golovinomyces magnicellulatus]
RANAHPRPDDVAAALDLSLQNLRIEYVDLYLMHSKEIVSCVNAVSNISAPVAYHRIGSGKDEWKTLRYEDNKPQIDMQQTQEYTSTWKAMEALVHDGKAKNIGMASNEHQSIPSINCLGVSNFMIKKLKKLLSTATITPAVNQVEIHPYLLEDELIGFCSDKNIHVTAFSPLGGKPVAAVALNANVPGPLFNETVISIAERLQLTPAQVLLKWGLQRGTSVIPKAYTESHIADNFAAKDLPDLSAYDMATINDIRKGQENVRYINAKNHWGFDIYDPPRDDPTEAEA